MPTTTTKTTTSLLPYGPQAINGHKVVLRNQYIDIETAIIKANEMLHKAGFIDLNLSSQVFRIERDKQPFLIGSFETDRTGELNLILASSVFKELFPEGFLIGCVCPDFNDPKRTLVMDDLK